GDLFLDGNEDERKGTNYLGNTHGGMLHLGEDWYIFYHRQTNRHSYSRQACAEKLVQSPDGSFRQAEVTSCGLNGGPLKGVGRYEARIACNLWSKDGVGRYDGNSPKKALKNHPYFTQTGRDREGNGDQYIANMQDGAVAGFKYFQMGEATTVSVEVSGAAEGRLLVSETADFSAPNAVIPIHSQGGGSCRASAGLQMEAGVKALYFRFSGSGAMNFIGFELS
ncbi:MAG: alpha-N-arabinofuranosidase, partial [Clostridiales bacterium]|nr:alpha-N-arabinofuranosidase [Clostridiales bacterium]